MAGQRRGHRPPGVAPQTSKRALYIDPIAKGISNSQAGRRVGINRRTGTRWRYGRTVTTAAGGQRHYPAVHRQEISERFLSQQERVVIADRLQDGVPLRRIAGTLGRSPSTISREIARNRDPSSGRYRPYAAQQRAAARRPRPKARTLTDPALRHYVQAHRHADACTSTPTLPPQQ